jgi:hypothetical protein
MQLMTKDEIKHFETYPRLNSKIRMNQFRPNSEFEKMSKGLSLNTKPFLLIKFVYFKITGKIFDEFSNRDLSSAIKSLGLVPENCRQPSRHTKDRHNKTIYKYFSVSPLTDKTTEYLRLLKLNIPLKTIFTSSLSFLSDQKIVIPSYLEIQNSFHRAYTIFQEGNLLLSSSLSVKQRNVLNEILGEKLADEDKNRPNLQHQVSKHKRLNHDQNRAGLKESLEQVQRFKEYYLLFSQEIEALSYDNDGYKKVAQEFIKLNISKVKRLHEDKRNIYLMCFIRHQFYRLNDHLVEIIINKVHTFQRKVRLQYNERVLEGHNQKNKKILEIINVAETESTLIEKIRAIAFSNSLEEQEIVKQIQKTLKNKLNKRTKDIQRVQDYKEELCREDNLMLSLHEENIDYLKDSLFNMIPHLDLYSERSSGDSIISAISFYNKMGEELEDLEAGEGCRRLIKNSIICWNYLYLTSRAKREKNEQKRMALLRAVNNSYIILWQHINFHGEFDLRKSNLRDTQKIDHYNLVKYNVLKVWEKGQSDLIQ